MSRTITLYSGWEILQGAALGNFKHGQSFVPSSGSASALCVRNLDNKDFNSGSVVVLDGKEDTTKRSYLSGFVWDLRREYIILPLSELNTGSQAELKLDPIEPAPEPDIMYCVNKEEENNA